MFSTQTLLRSEDIITAYAQLVSVDVRTKNGHPHHFFPVNRQVFKFDVKASNDAIIALTTTRDRTRPFVEIILGCSNNTKSVIRKNESDVCSNETTKILDGNNLRCFSIRWTKDTLYVKSEWDGKNILTWQYQELFKVNYVGVRTDCGSDGTWHFLVANEEDVKH